MQLIEPFQRGLRMSCQRLRRVRGGDLGRVVGDAGGIDAGPEKRAGRRAQMVGLVGGRFGRDVAFVAALFLEIDRRREVGKLDDVDVEAAGGAFGQDLVVERAGLGAHIAGVDLREILAKSLHDAGGAGLVLVTIEHELAFLLGLGDVGIGHEIENFGRRFQRRLGQYGGGRDPQERHRGAGLQQRAPRHIALLAVGQFTLPVVCFLFLGPLRTCTSPATICCICHVALSLNQGTRFDNTILHAAEQTTRDRSRL